MVDELWKGTRMAMTDLKVLKINIDYGTSIRRRAKLISNTNQSPTGYSFISISHYYIVLWNVEKNVKKQNNHHPDRPPLTFALHLYVNSKLVLVRKGVELLYTQTERRLE